MPSGERRLEICLDGAVVDTVLDDLIELEVVDSIGEHSSLSLNLVMRKRDDGEWTHLDANGAEVVFAPWQRITVRAGFGSDLENLFDGYVAHITPYFAPDEAECSLRIGAYGSTWMMDQEDRQVRWEDKSFSQAATAIIESYGLSPRVDDTTTVYRQDDHTLIQAGTDWEFLQHLAQQVGFELFGDGVQVWFREPVPDTPLQHDIAVHCGPLATNAVWFRPSVHAGPPSSLTSGEGELDGALYGALLRVGRSVNIKGTGTAWSGTYYVRRVEHRVTPTGYTQRFRVERSRTRQNGTEVTSATSKRTVAP